MKALFTRAARESLGPALLAASVGTVAMFVVRYLFLIPTPPELYGDRATVLIPVNLFSALLQTFGSNTKHIFFVALVVGAALLAVVFGVIYWAARVWATSRNADIASRLGASPGWLDALLVWTLLFALTAGVVAPLLGGGFLGAQLQTGIGGALLSLLTPITAFTASFIPLMRRNLETLSEGNEEDWRHRRPALAAAVDWPRRVCRRGGRGRYRGVAIYHIGPGSQHWSAHAVITPSRTQFCQHAQAHRATADAGIRSLDTGGRRDARSDADRGVLLRLQRHPRRSTR